MPAETSASDRIVERRLVDRPYFSICIPQHNRTSFLIEVCRSLERQRFRQFEVCISDDASTDGREGDLLEYLKSSRLSFVYRRLATNRRYDGNLRAAIELARGEFCFLLGNDDVLAEPDTLDQLHQIMTRHATPAVVFTNFADFATGRVTHRVPRTAVVGAGPATAARGYRKFSFVSGVVLRREPAQAAAVTRWDGSEMYQMYIGCRLIAAGGALLETDLVTVRKDVQVPGETVDNYATRERVHGSGIPQRRIPLASVAGLVIDAIAPHLQQGRLRPMTSVLIQYFGFLYPFWLLEYRRVQSWHFAAGVARAMRPKQTLAGCALPATARILASITYAGATLVGLGAPRGLLTVIHRPARLVARKVGEWAAAC
jgi:hypothetical protein